VSPCLPAASDCELGVFWGLSGSEWSVGCFLSMVAVSLLSHDPPPLTHSLTYLLSLPPHPAPQEQVKGSQGAGKVDEALDRAAKADKGDEGDKGKATKPQLPARPAGKGKGGRR
jgi:hypothetical protein